MKDELTRIAFLFLIFLIIFVLEYVMVYLVTKEKRKRSFTWLMYAGMALVLALLAFFTQNMPLGAYLVFHAVVDTALSLLLHRYIFKVVDWRVIFFLAMFNTIVLLPIQKIVTAILGLFVSGPATTRLGNLLTYSIMLVIFLLLSKTRVFFVLGKIARFPKLALTIAMVVSLLNVAIELINSIVFLNTLSGFQIALYAASYVAVIAVYVFLLREYLREQRLRESEALVLQQQVYLQKLEAIQLDLRKIHHDYKNVATGLYAKMESGDVADAQAYISTKMLQMDKEIRLDLQQMNQLTNIEVIELKTLLMAKAMQAEKVNVQLIIEVMEPVKKVPMEISDLLRCGGILLDNAIEAAANEHQRQVTIVLLKENGKLTFMVKNPVSQSVDLQRIWTDGYSTKGKNRGLGLANLKEITHRYPDVWLETRVEKQEFIQLMTFKLI
ncbi:GHKL domain-containing protein [Enterococcus sp. 669A]|uniref:GHKL domain-containing protein n=1 Tax=Candidatus Enterococcus moelleringii TaxID=2815325 RepID=A0ABS3L6H6_9ENTE|nr:GHKL domain-containing protein [Enterococcus sp. 669A]MBO1305219.1 GHKL domain-containing protein [Enterococcus sp. 669A]